MNHCSEISGSIRTPERWSGVYLQRTDDGCLGLGDRHTGERLAGLSGHPPVLADHRDWREAVAAADFEVVEVVRGRDLQRPGAELRLDVIVGDDRQPPPNEGQDRCPADQVRVALIVRVHRHGDIPQHRLRPHGRDHQLPLAVRERIRDPKQCVGLLALLDLEV
jgi:hypothetical protein